MQKSKNAQHSVAVVISEGLGLFEFGIATEVFGLNRPEFTFPWYEFNVVSATTKTVTATGGVTVSANEKLEALTRVDTIIIPSWNSDITPSDELINALHSANKRKARLLSICSGVFLFAAAGLLDNKKVTTHWRHVERLKTLYPKIDVSENDLYVDLGNIICSAGSAAGIDACMHLVRRDFGIAIANDVARRLVAHPHRSGGQKQFIPTPIAVRENHNVSTAMEWALEHISQKISVKEMAQQVHMSERTFLRRFRENAGCTPKEWLQRMRISKAQALIETTNKPLNLVAEQTGYQSIEAFRLAFKRQTGLSASAYRSRFNTSDH